MKVYDKIRDRDRDRERGALVKPEFLSTEEVSSFELLKKTQGSSNLQNMFLQSATTCENWKTQCQIATNTC